MKKNISIKKQQIVEYWRTRVDEGDLGVDWSEADERCWRCGNRKTLHRSHIISEAFNGDLNVSNFVLLCSRCHRESPNTKDPNDMWLWIKRTKAACYGEYDILDTFREFERLFGKSVEAAMGENPVYVIEQINSNFEAVKKWLLYGEVIGSHFDPAIGQVISASSKAILLYKLIEKIKKGDFKSSYNSQIIRRPYQRKLL